MTKNDVVGSGVSLLSLKERRSALLNEVKLLDDAIKALENLERYGAMGLVAPNYSNGIANAAPQQASIIFQEETAIKDTFSNLTTIEAAINVLDACGPMKTQDIINEMEKRGKKINGKNPFTNVFSVLNKNTLSKNPRVKKFGDGIWGLVS
jgi:hypothetical protein